MTRFFFIQHIGHGGGGWLMLCCNNHPSDSISLVGECAYRTCLDFEGRGIEDTHDNYDRELHKYFEDRMHYGGRAVGVVKSIHTSNIAWARQKVGRENVVLVSMIRNPMHRFFEKWRRKARAAASWYMGKFHEKAVSERELAEATSAYLALNYHKQFLDNGIHVPVIRLEDVNRSIRLRTPFFRRLMEYLTNVEWPDDYIEHIRENWTPGYQYRNWLEWDDEERKGRVKKVVTLQRDIPTWSIRDNWEDDPEPGKHWRLRGDQPREEWEREAYLKYHAEIDRREGYNQTAPGTVEDDWEYRGAYPWGDVYDA